MTNSQTKKKASRQAKGKVKIVLRSSTSGWLSDLSAEESQKLEAAGKIGLDDSRRARLGELIGTHKSDLNNYADAPRASVVRKQLEDIERKSKALADAIGSLGDNPDGSEAGERLLQQATLNLSMVQRLEEMIEKHKLRAKHYVKEQRKLQAVRQIDHLIFQIQKVPRRQLEDLRAMHAELVALSED